MPRSPFQKSFLLCIRSRNEASEGPSAPSSANDKVPLTQYGLAVLRTSVLPMVIAAAFPTIISGIIIVRSHESSSDTTYFIAVFLSLHPHAYHYLVHSHCNGQSSFANLIYKYVVLKPPVVKNAYGGTRATTQMPTYVVA